MRVKILIKDNLINYKVSGVGTPLIFLHGWGCDLHIFDKIVAQINEDFTVYQSDLPGCGESEINAEYSIEEYASIINLFCLMLDINNPCIVGHSFGGRVAIKYASLYKVNKLVLVASPGIKEKFSIIKWSKIKIYNPGENEVRALDGVSLEIEEGEFVAIVGHSGSGKSTLMNMLGCLDVPTEGTYVLNGRDVSSLTDNELSEVRNLDIGFIFQGFNLIPNLNALENVELPLIYRNVEKSKRRELAKAALEKVGLGNRMKHKPSEMSGGQQQRVAIARAIAATPPLILADEPTGNLDSKSTKDIMKILNSLNEQGNTIVLITHDDGIAENAKRVVRIMDGKIESDTKKQLFNEADYYERDIECVDVELYEGEVADVHDEGIEFVEVSGFVNNEMS